MLRVKVPFVKVAPAFAVNESPNAAAISIALVVAFPFAEKYWLIQALTFEESVEARRTGVPPAPVPVTTTVTESAKEAA